MSGRSAHVRKEKTKVKDGHVQSPQQQHFVDSDHGSETTPSIYGDFPVPDGHQAAFQSELKQSNVRSSSRTIRSEGSDDLAYARVRKPATPVIDVSGIEKSSFRSLMDKRSDGIRVGLAKTFGKKKKKTEELRAESPGSSSTVRPPDSHELEAGEYVYQPPSLRPRNQPLQEAQEFSRPGPPLGKLPPIPQAPQLKRWVGSGSAPKPWNKLRKDPELWDPNGDTLIFFGHDDRQNVRPPPSFRISSHVLEDTQSRFLITLLREGLIDDSNSFSMPPSPVSSPGVYPKHPAGRGRNQPTPPGSENGVGTYDGQISYGIYFPAPNGSKTDILRHQVTTRNVFALLYQASLVGVHLFQALNDLHERLEVYMPPDTDAAGMLIDYLVAKGIDDVRGDPSSAAALLAWSESQGVRWEEGWREAYVHSAGMYHRVENCGEFKFVTPITKALLERASLDMQVRVQHCEERIAEFDFEDMWPLMSSHPPPARSAFERLRKFFLQQYESSYETWPPAIPHGSEQWLTRDIAQRLQKDFGALYDYLVNREVTWDCSEERSGRKWNIVNPGNKAFDADTPDIPFTDILVAFDNRHRYPHIPHPYPLTPEPILAKRNSRENQFKPAKKNKSVEDKMAERKAALAYTESTNIYLLSSDFVTNDLVEEFVRFEKGDRAGDVDPCAARRGRWVLIYGILQTLASVSVDTPNLRYTDEVSYHLSPRLRGTPPWKGANQYVEEANHGGSYCWSVRETWQIDQPVSMPRVKPLYMKSSTPPVTPSIMSESDGASSVRSHTLSSTTTRSGGRHRHPRIRDSDTSYSGYAPGIEKLDEWPMTEQSLDRGRGRDRGSPTAFMIKDFDDEYHS
ncbi:hypothetical protein LSUB1_G008653 [Lachnellula subtilissima]|uniref:DUF8004 domain-containing protein n=1 Tax=Lachnellula subtilissima TaxID=602034 RepID=A0A8H8RES4_9HELO|nr:hypothetical protein LSUB1_G008653 [Lachnellula subtilissima]